MRLRAGQDAPLFEIRDFYGRRVTLAQYWGHPVLLAFHRAANCPLCNLRLWHLIRKCGAKTPWFTDGDEAPRAAWWRQSFRTYRLTCSLLPGVVNCLPTAGPAGIYACGGGFGPRHDGVRLARRASSAVVSPRIPRLQPWGAVNYRYPTYQRQGMAVLAFFESAPDFAHEYLDRLRPPFPLIADLELRVYNRYRLESSWLGALRARLTRGAAYREATRLRIGGHPWLNPLTMDGHPGRLPADFLLEPDLRIHTAYYGHDAGDFMLFEEIDAFLAARPWRQVGLM